MISKLIAVVIVLNFLIFLSVIKPDELFRSLNLQNQLSNLNSYTEHSHSLNNLYLGHGNIKGIITGKQAKAISEIVKIDTHELYQGSEIKCKVNDDNCIYNFFEDLTTLYGPEKALQISTLLQNDKKIREDINIHHIAHVVGRKTAATFGYDPDSYLLCPESGYFGGCSHGYFEYYLTKTLSIQGAREICQTFKRGEYSEVFILNCYHGIGHGIYLIMNKDLNASLNLCEEIGYLGGNESCWNGVFMEAFEPPQENSVVDLLNSCNSLDSKFAKHCFGNLIGFYLGETMEKEGLPEFCLANEMMREACSYSLGTSIVDKRTDNKSSIDELINKTITECNDSQEILLEYCIDGALQRLMFNEAGVDIAKDARKLCSQIENINAFTCYQKINKYLDMMIVDKEIKRYNCGLMPKAYRDDCYL